MQLLYKAISSYLWHIYFGVEVHKSNKYIDASEIKVTRKPDTRVGKYFKPKAVIRLFSSPQHISV